MLRVVRLPTDLLTDLYRLAGTKAVSPFREIDRRMMDAVIVNPALERRDAEPTISGRVRDDDLGGRLDRDSRRVALIDNDERRSRLDRLAMAESGVGVEVIPLPDIPCRFIALIAARPEPKALDLQAFVRAIDDDRAPIVREFAKEGAERLAEFRRCELQRMVTLVIRRIDGSLGSLRVEGSREATEPIADRSLGLLVQTERLRTVGG